MNSSAALRAVAFLLISASLWSVGDAAAGEDPQWVWEADRSEMARPLLLRKTFSIRNSLRQAMIEVVGDFSELRVRVNEQRVLKVTAFEPKRRLRVEQWLRMGENRLLVEATPLGGPAAAACQLRVVYDDDSQEVWRTDNAWQASADQGATWNSARTYGRVADGIWHDPSEPVEISLFDDYTQWKQALGDNARTDPLMYVTLPGFSFERLRVAQDDEGSWVSMAFDPRGRLVVAKEDRGLLRMTLRGRSAEGDAASDVRVEQINDSLLECRGLLFAFGSLYAQANNSKTLYRLRDTTGDDQFDESQALLTTSGGVGHGRNDLALGPDQKIYAIHGDSVDLPRDATDWTSALREHRRGENSQEGFVLRTDADGKHVELVTAGLRNPFGIDFNRNGEMFTYDADAEYDMGSPWYRPTRVNHLLLGGDFGWRGVTKSWPPYYCNQLEFAPPNLDVGKGSPTAIKFGYSSNFPPPYRQALYVLDWAYGRVLAIHLLPRGSSYVCRPETFIKGRPLNVTDIDFGPDGAMYLITGGRKTRSALYRVSFQGDSPPAPPARETRQQAARRIQARQARGLRRQLEKLLTSTAAADIDTAWPHLDSPDPRIRYAARGVLENRPAELWGQRALHEENPRRALTALLALARVDQPSYAVQAGRRLSGLPWTEFCWTDQARALRALELCLRQAGSDAAFRVALRQGLESLYPSQTWDLNQRLSKLLIALDSESAVTKSMDLLDADGEQSHRMHYQFVLRSAKRGWTDSLRDRYFVSLQQMERNRGGEGMPAFVKRIREDALSNLDPPQRSRFAVLLEKRDRDVPRLIAESEKRKLVENWTVEALLPALEQLADGRDFQAGKRLFSAALCAVCHRMQSEGGLIGPDLSSVASRFSRRDLLASIIQPSRVVAPPYQGVSLVTRDGRVLTGQPAAGGDYRAPELQLITNAFYPDRLVVVKKVEIESHQPSPLSPMPTGLLNTFTKAEILDLLAYLEAGGNPAHQLYR